jgi:perosamine synthetase
MRNIPFGKPFIGDAEKKAVMKVLNNPILVHGPKSKEFETAFANYIKAPHAISVSSCTAALHLSYFYLNLNKGDEVIVPAQTHVATAHAVELMGAKPVFVDAEKITGNIDIEQIESAITKHTKAISIVHYLGMPVDMSRVMEIAKKHNLFVVEDCALAVGAYYKGIHAGLHGDIGCFSFYPIKHMTTAEGGMLITKNDKIAASTEQQRAFGMNRHHANKRKVPGIYDVTQLGFNYRMSEVHASIGIEQLKKMSKFLEKRKLNYERLTTGLQEIDGISLFKSTHDNFQSSYYCHSILLDNSIVAKRFKIIDYLKQNGVGTSVYYPQAVPQMTYYKNKYGHKKNSHPIAEWISNSSIALPVGPHLNQKDMDYIIKTLKIAIKKIS